MFKMFFRSGSVARILSNVRNPLYRNGYALTASSAIVSLVGVAYWLLAARHYPVAVVGTNSAAIAVMTFLSGLAGLYMDGTLVRFIPRAGVATVRLVGLVYFVITIVAALVSGMFLFGLRVWSPALLFLTSSPWLSVGFVFATVTWCIFVVQDGVLTGLRQAVWVPVENAIYAVAKLGLLLVFSYFLPEYGILASWTVPTVMLIVPINYFIFRRLIPRHTQAAQNMASPLNPVSVVKYAGGNYIGLLFYLAYSMLPPVMVLELAGSSASAYFYLPWVIGSLLRLVATNMSTALVVEGSLDQTRLPEYFRRALVNTTRLLAPVVAIVVVAAPHLLRIFGDDYATEGMSLLRLLALATIPNIVVFLYVGLLRVQNRIGEVIVVHGLTGLAMLGLSYVWLRSYGIAGVGLAWLVTQTGVAMFLLATELRPILRHQLAPLEDA
jgi:O-antigen/teichoic acid export membrane protein